LHRPVAIPRAANINDSLDAFVLVSGIIAQCFDEANTVMSHWRSPAFFKKIAENALYELI
jgi:hypothetical protein